MAYISELYNRGPLKLILGSSTTPTDTVILSCSETEVIFEIDGYSKTSINKRNIKYINGHRVRIKARILNAEKDDITNWKTFIDMYNKSYSIFPNTTTKPYPSFIVIPNFTDSINDQVYTASEFGHGDADAPCMQLISNIAPVKLSNKTQSGQYMDLEFVSEKLWIEETPDNVKIV